MLTNPPVDRYSMQVRGSTVTPHGQVDQLAAPALREALAQAARAEGGRLRLDLREVDYFDSAGVAVLFEFGYWHPMSISVRRGSAVARVLRIVNLAGIVEIRDFAPLQPMPSHP